jgi:hypothetical protein
MLPNGNKQFYLNIGAHLQGSDTYTEYITGGANRPETQRRVDIFETITNVKPKTRAPRNSKKKDDETLVKRGRGRPKKMSTGESTEIKSEETPKKTLSKTTSCRKMNLSELPAYENYMMETFQNHTTIDQKNNLFEEEFYSLTEEEMLQEIIDLDNQQDNLDDEDDMNAILDYDNVSFRSPLSFAYSPCNPVELVGSSVKSNSSYHSNKPQLSINCTEVMNYEEKDEMMVVDVVNENLLTGKKRALSVNELFSPEDIELLLTMDTDHEFEDDHEDDEEEEDQEKISQKHKRLISLHRSRGFAKIPLNEPVPVQCYSPLPDSEFPNRSILSYRFNFASIGSHDSTDVEESVEPDDFDEDDELVNGIDACFDGLTI